MANNEINGKSLPVSKKQIFVSVISLVMLVSLYYFYQSQRYVTTDDAYVKANITILSSEINGKVSEMNVTDNQAVKLNDVLFSIEKEPYQIAVAAKSAKLTNIESNIRALKAEYQSNLAQLEKAKLDLDFYNQEYERIKKLTAQGASSQNVLDQAILQFEKAKFSLKQSEADLAKSLANLNNNKDIEVNQHADYLQAKAELDRAKYDLDKTDVRAPAEGTVAKLSLLHGSYVMAGMPLFSLVDTSKPWIEAHFKEINLDKIAIGQLAEVTVDSYPNKIWQARVTSITPATGSEFAILPAQNSSGNWVKVTQRVMVKLELLDVDTKYRLASGMSVFVSIDTSKKS